ncbi:MAG TPA: efflux RND transporter periplasmic adaptor subunit [Gemmatimonadales bacterium]|nr:efflux RND transporter periplasmic adaptor subunit [Gemmatimonadales bacterium]
MNRIIVAGLAGVLVIGACREKPAPTNMAAMPDMSAGGADTAKNVGERQPVRLTAVQAQALGVTYTVVTRGPLHRSVRTVGQVVPAEPNLAEITPKVDGFVDRLFVDATGVQVRRGEPLLALYSPMLVSAQEELLTALHLAQTIDSTAPEAWRNAQDLVAAARRRLAYWDISEEQIERLERTGEVTKTLTLVAPFDGVVMEKMVVAGQSVMPGMKLYRLANLSTVWVEGEVFEQDLALIRVGAPVRVELTAYPGQTLTGRVAFVWPVVDEQSRTGKVRVALANAKGLIKPGMYATLLFDATVGRDALSLPAEAVVLTGERNLVFVVGKDGALEPRQVTLGARAGDRIQVLDGVAEGERVVASANFLVDAESRLTSGAGMAGMPGMNMEQPGKKERRP